MELREWTVLYVKHKDIFARKLQRVEEKPDKLTFHFKDHAMHAYAMETLSLPPEMDGKTLIVTLHTKKNMESLIKNWNDFSEHAHLTIVFVNPHKNEKWFIIPHTHSQIADPDVALGIKSLAENVTLVG
jgi:hypothetical protein